MRSSTSLALARALFGVIGIGALLMVIGGLSSGESLSDPPFVGGLVLGTSMLGAAILARTSGRLPAVVVGAAVLAVAVTLSVLGAMVIGAPSVDAIVLFAVPAVIVAAAAGRLAIARLRPPA